MTATAKHVCTEIDQRCDLGGRYWHAERTDMASTPSVNVRCEVLEDCGATIQPGEPATLWRFMLNRGKGDVLGWLCENCDADLVAQSEAYAWQS
jgi:hypothetical protein